MPEVTLAQAAETLETSRSSIVRRIQRGQLSGRKEVVEGREVWRVTIPNEEDKPVAERTNEGPDDGEDYEVVPFEDGQDVNEETLAEAMAPEAAILCPVCQKPIEDDDDYIDSAHGQVHAEPCSHQSIPLTSGT